MFFLDHSPARFGGSWRRKRRFPACRRKCWSDCPPICSAGVRMFVAPNGNLPPRRRWLALRPQILFPKFFLTGRCRPAECQRQRLD